MNYTWDQVVAWLGIVIPLATLAWAAVSYVRNEKREQSYREYQKFFEIMRELGSKESTVSGNMAAVFELRQFPQYSDVIVRLCEDAKLKGSAAEVLDREMKLTADHMKALK